MYPITVPILHWFEYQVWLAQNYLYPISDYCAYPEDFFNMVLSFTRESDRQHFEQRWGHTL